MAFEALTKNGYNLFEMSSMIQKAIRRCDIPHAAYAANEMSVKYRAYLWKRLLTVSAEDCYGIMTKEIMALKEADDYVNQRNKPGETNDLFIAKAVVLLCILQAAFLQLGKDVWSGAGAGERGSGSPEELGQFR